MAHRPRPGALPNLVIIGAMKCGTTSLHHYLDLHPEVAMSRPKELNFFLGDDGPPAGTGAVAGADDAVDWARGTWHRGARWYADRFDPAAPVRGEASPGYTSPSHPDVAARMADIVPEAQLVYAVRDPIRRAVSQYWHHRRDGTESREPEEALLDPGSQYLARSRYLERLAPFLAPFAGRIALVAQEELEQQPRATMRRLFGLLGVDGDYWSDAMTERRNSSPEELPMPGRSLRQRLVDTLSDDAERFRAFAGRDLPRWSV